MFNLHVDVMKGHVKILLRVAAYMQASGGDDGDAALL